MIDIDNCLLTEGYVANNNKAEWPMTETISSGTPMLDYALDYARRGAAVFPCKPDKTPYVGSDRDANGDKIAKTGGLYKATTDEATIRSWWAQHPRAMIGIRMGKTSGMWALDPDAPEGDKPDGRANWRRLKSENGGCPITHTHNTPGGGQHLLFKWDDAHPITNSEGGIKGRGINVRGEGYVIAPPSVNAEGKAYDFAEALDFWNFAHAPDWLYDLITPKAPAIALVMDSPPLVPAADPLSITERALANVNANVVQFKDSNRTERTYCERALNDERDALTATRLDRNIALNNAALALGSLVGPGRLSESEVYDALVGASISNGYDKEHGRRATKDTINSGLSKGLQQPRVIPDREVARPDPTESATVLAKPVTIRATPYVWKAASAIPRREWLYGTHLIRRYASATIAPGGVGKSSVILTDAIAMATGRDLLGSKPSQRLRVWCWNGEDPSDEMDRRIAAICLHYKIE
jgi:hypothetical protein